MFGRGNGGDLRNTSVARGPFNEEARNDERIVVLLIEDSPSDRRLLCESLEASPLDLDIITAETLEEALQLIDRRGFGLVMVDLDLPDSVGPETVELIRRAAPDLPVIVVSGNHDELAALELLRRGAQDYLVKSELSDRELIRAVNFAIQRQSMMSERDRVAQELRASEARVRAIIDAGVDAMIVVDTRGIVRFANQAALAMFPIGGPLLGQPFGFPLVSGQSAEIDFRSSVANTVGIAEMRVVETLWNGKPAFLATLRDVTEQRRTAYELIERERRFRGILANGRMASVMLDRDGCVTFCNDHLLSLTGWSAMEVLGRNWFELFVPEGDAESRRIVADLLANGIGRWDHENEILTRSGDRRLIQWSHSLLRSEDDSVIGIASLGVDMTDRRIAELRVRRLNRVYAVLSGINSLIVRVSGREALFREACRIAVEIGGFELAWIGSFSIETRRVEPLAWLAQRDLAQELHAWRLGSDQALIDGVESAVRGREAVVMRTGIDPLGAKGKGPASVVVLPLIVGGAVTEILALHAREVDFFDEEELKLLQELVDDISFALDYIDKSRTLERLANYDALTALPNRSLLMDRLTQTLQRCASERRNCGVLFIDLDRFKLVNDTLGHAVGDQLLRVIADRISSCLGFLDSAARFGGDEFVAIVSEDPTEPDSLARTVQRIVSRVSETIRIEDHDLITTCSVGIARYPEHGHDADTLVQHADSAMLLSKQQGGNNFTSFSQEHDRNLRDRLGMESALRLAIQRRELQVLYQPKVDAINRRIVGVEALLRWNHSARGLISPAQFIPIAEESDLILTIGEWVLRTACTELRDWEWLHIAVNLSARQFMQGTLTDTIETVLKETGIAPARLELELTETTLMHDFDQALKTLSALRRAGVRMALDDFGTGYSSLSYLRRFPIDVLKIDRSFVMSVADDANSEAIVEAIVSLARRLNLEVVAEGVEQARQAEILQSQGCDQLQGYLFAPPLNLNTLRSVLNGRTRLPL